MKVCRSQGPPILDLRLPTPPPQESQGRRGGPFFPLLPRGVSAPPPPPGDAPPPRRPAAPGTRGDAQGQGQGRSWPPPPPPPVRPGSFPRSACRDWEGWRKPRLPTSGARSWPACLPPFPFRGPSRRRRRRSPRSQVRAAAAPSCLLAPPPGEAVAEFGEGGPRRALLEERGRQAHSTPGGGG